MSVAIAAFSGGVGGAATIAGIDLGPIASGSGGLGAPGPQDSNTPPAPPNGQHVGDACRAGGNKPGHLGWVHLDPSSAEHYGTYWMWTCLDN
jgi:hypothetical protein